MFRAFHGHAVVVVDVISVSKEPLNVAHPMHPQARNPQAQVKCSFHEQYRNMRYWFDQVIPHTQTYRRSQRYRLWADRHTCARIDEVAGIHHPRACVVDSARHVLFVQVRVC